MSNELKPQDEPNAEVKPTDELTDEQLNNVAGGIGGEGQPAPTPPPTSPDVRKAGKGQQEYLVMKMNEVIIS